VDSFVQKMSWLFSPPARSAYSELGARRRRQDAMNLRGR